MFADPSFDKAVRCTRAAILSICLDDLLHLLCRNQILLQLLWVHGLVKHVGDIDRLAQLLLLLAVVGGNIGEVVHIYSVLRLRVSIKLIHFELTAKVLLEASQVDLSLVEWIRGARSATVGTARVGGPLNQLVVDLLVC